MEGEAVLSKMLRYYIWLGRGSRGNVTTDGNIEGSEVGVEDGSFVGLDVSLGFFVRLAVGSFVGFVVGLL